MDRQPTLSVVIPVHNAAGTLPEQLDAVLGSIDDDMEVVVVDNRSTDASRSIAEQRAAVHPRLRVVEARDRAGEAYARNTGWRAARAPAVAFCDADDVVSRGWARAMRDALADAEYVTGPVELDLLNPPWLAGVRGRTIYTTVPVTVGGVPFAHGCNVGMRRAVLSRLGGFDDPGAGGNVRRRGTGAEDVDLAIRAWREGVRLEWEPRAVVHYRHRTSGRARWHQAVSYGIAAAHVHHVLGEPWALRDRLRRQRRRARWLIATAPLTVRRAHRAQWMWTLGLVVGELRGEAS